MEGIGKNAQEEFKKGTIAVSQGCEARLKEKAKEQAIPFKIDVQAELPPCLIFWADDRNLGVGAKAEQPPVPKTDHKTEMGTDSFSTEKGNRPINSKRNKSRRNGRQMSGIRMIGGIEWAIIGPTQADGGNLGQRYN